VGEPLTFRALSPVFTPSRGRVRLGASVRVSALYKKEQEHVRLRSRAGANQLALESPSRESSHDGRLSHSLQIQLLQQDENLTRPTLLSKLWDILSSDLHELGMVNSTQIPLNRPRISLLAF
jgi:hypothetical protein